MEGIDEPATSEARSDLIGREIFACFVFSARTPTGGIVDDLLFALESSSVSYRNIVQKWGYQYYVSRFDGVISDLRWILSSEVLYELIGFAVRCRYLGTYSTIYLATWQRVVI